MQLLTWSLVLFRFIFAAFFCGVVYFFSATTGNSQFVLLLVLHCRSIYLTTTSCSKTQFIDCCFVSVGKRIFTENCCKTQIWNTKTIKKNNAAITSFVVTVLFLGDFFFFFVQFGAEKNNKQHNKTFWNTQLTI